MLALRRTSFVGLATLASVALAERERFDGSTAASDGDSIAGNVATGIVSLLAFALFSSCFVALTWIGICCFAIVSSGIAFETERRFWPESFERMRKDVERKTEERSRSKEK